MHSLSKSFASTQGQVRYEIHGDGAPVVLVHGTPSSSFLWSNIWPRLTCDRQVILYDLPGYGASEKFDGQDVRLRTQARVLAELIAHLGLQHPHLVGHDFGAATVLGAHLVNDVPVDSLTIIDGVTLNPWGTAYSKLVRAKIGMFQALSDAVHEATVAAHLRSAVSRNLDDATLRALLAPWCGETGKAAYYRQIAQYDQDFTGYLEPLYPSIAVPTQILWGVDDLWLPPTTALRLEVLIPGARLDWLPKAGHFAMLDAPDLVVEKITGFLNSCDQTPRASRQAKPAAVAPRGRYSQPIA